MTLIVHQWSGSVCCGNKVEVRGCPKLIYYYVFICSFSQASRIERIVEWLRVEGTFEHLVVQAPCLEQVAQDLVQSGFEYVCGWRLCNISGQHVPRFGSSPSKT